MKTLLLAVYIHLPFLIELQMLFRYKVMLILILIDVQYVQNVVLFTLTSYNLLTNIDEHCLNTSTLNFLRLAMSLVCDLIIRKVLHD